MLPIIFQHVREFAEIHSGTAESNRYKLITPFPPVGNDFKDFIKENLEFTDPQSDAALAGLDTIHAYDFFKETDNLYYDYSYGIKSQDYLLSHICGTFYRGAVFADTEDTNFIESFAEKKDAFLRKYERFTVGELGQFPFRYTSLSPIQWIKVNFAITLEEIKRLKEKTLAVYKDVEISNKDFINSLITEINAQHYSKIEYDLGFFDVIREWIDPQLFESNKWKFNTDAKVLYGENDPYFEANEVRLCYAQRFYIIKNYSAVVDSPSPPIIRDHRGTSGGVTVTRNPRNRPVIRDHRRSGQIRDHLFRRVVRNNLLESQISRFELQTKPIATTGRVPSPREGFVWVEATSSVPGHWERQKAGTTNPVTTPDNSANDSIYKIAAVKCRIIPRKPQKLLL